MAGHGALEWLVPELAELPLTLLDVAALGVVLLITVGYHSFYALWAGRHPLETVKGKTALYRRTWVKRILDRDEPMLAVQSVRNLLMTSSFMASSALLVIAVVLNFVLTQVAQATPEARLLAFKLLVLATIHGYAFFSFLLSTRYLNHFSILVAADKDLIGSVEPVDAVTFLSNMLNRAGNRFTMGQRAFYFSLPLVAWIVDARAFLALTVLVFLYLAVFLDFKRWRPPFPLRAAVPEAPAEPAQPPAAAGPGSARPAGEGRGSR